MIGEKGMYNAEWKSLIFSMVAGTIEFNSLVKWWKVEKGKGKPSTQAMLT